MFSYDDAERSLRVAISLDHNHQNSYYNLGLVLHAQVTRSNQEQYVNYEWQCRMSGATRMH